LDPERGESLVCFGDRGGVGRQRPGVGPADELASVGDEGAAGDRRDLLAEARAGRDELRRRELERELGCDEGCVAAAVLDEPDCHVVAADDRRGVSHPTMWKLATRRLRHTGGDATVPSGRKRQVDAVAGEVVPSLSRCRGLRLVRLERERREDPVHLGDRRVGRTLART
jgi:hypothetical protein